MDLVTDSNPGWLELNLKELWRYRDLIGLMVRRDFVSAYKQTVLGPLWHLTEPLVTALTYAFIFGSIANISTDGMPRILFYLAGIFLWTFFSNGLLTVSGSFSSNAHLYGKVYFPRLAIPIANIINGMIAFGMQFLLFLAIMAFYYVGGTDIRISSLALLTPVLILMTAGLAMGLGMLLSSVTTRYQDLRKLVGVSMRLLMFATPIIYPMSKVPEQYQWIIRLNPMTSIVESFRYGWLGSGSFSPGNLSYSFAFMIGALLLGALAFNRAEKTAMDTV
jgi:lipopolysaccharide transport system permease protein